MGDRVNKTAKRARSKSYEEEDPLSSSSGSIDSADYVEGPQGSLEEDYVARKRHRRTAAEIERSFFCDVCLKAYGSIGALNMHVKLKHTKANSPASFILDPEIVKTLKTIDIQQPLWGSNAHVGQVISQGPMAAPTPARMPVLPTQPLFIQKSLNSHIPALNMKMGAWQKSSIFCGDIAARFFFEERKLAWEIFSLNQSFSKVEIPFQEVSSLNFIELSDGICSLSLESVIPPLFYNGTIIPHQPTIWKPTNSFAKLGNGPVRFQLYFLTESVAPSIRQLLISEPRLQRCPTDYLLQQTLAPHQLQRSHLDSVYGVDQMYISPKSHSSPRYASSGSTFIFEEMTREAAAPDVTTSCDINSFLNLDKLA